MSKAQFKTTYLKDYTAPNFAINDLHLTFDLVPEATRVIAEMRLERLAEGDLELDGDALRLIDISLDDEILPESRYVLHDGGLTIKAAPSTFTLRITTEINPAANTELSGLYLSKGIFCTQCEAHGFRRITYYMDRPDVMTRFTTKIIADKSRYPILLANGNQIAQGDLDNNRHWATWEDPFKKPSYLFALVAGDLEYREDFFTTQSGREITLRLFVEKGNLDKTEHAMTSLQKSMRWDEERYGREYDLDIFMIVAVSAFNMGAMENKGLNIFNDKYILAKPETATDFDYESIESVVAHEYFHNWTGNRITCRDWFQLSLKEGLTVFRDQEFSRDMNSRDVNRIQDIQILRAHQFPEDDGPMAHSVRPDAYIEVNNFYTATVYNKGAEVIRMQETLLGRDGFRQGMDLYFQRHDGQAVTCDDFVKAMEDANDVDFSQFKAWYSQAGTPIVSIEDNYDANAQTLTLTVRQTCPDTPGQSNKQPFHIPMALGLLDSNGREIDFSWQNNANNTTQVLEIREAEQRFVLENIPVKPILSLFRDFSAPVKVDYSTSDEELLHLLAHDPNGFARWEAGQRLITQYLLRLIDDVKQQRELVFKPELANAFANILADTKLDPALQAKILAFPSYEEIGEHLDKIDIHAIHTARQFLLKSIAAHLQAQLLGLFKELQYFGGFDKSSTAIARRSLKNAILGLLAENDIPEVRQLSSEQFAKANNMTDSIAALAALAKHPSAEKEQALTSFYQKWQDDDLVVDKWFSLQARIDSEETLTTIQDLLKHEAFSLENPNRARSLIGAFAVGNPAIFHHRSGAGYAFLAEQVLKMDKLNPQVAARMVNPFVRWKKYNKSASELMYKSLSDIAKSTGLSKDVYEIVAKSLES